MGQIRNQLSSLTFAELDGKQLSDAAGKAFVSINSIASQEEVVAITKTWSAIHAPTFGLPIPGSAKTITSTDASPNVLAPTTNQTAYVNGMSVNNTSGSDAATVSITIGNAVVFKQSVPAGETAVVVGAQALTPFYLANPSVLGIVATGATPGDVAVVCSYALAVQE